MTADQLTFHTVRYRCTAIRHDCSWGHGLEVSVHDSSSGDLLNSLHFLCHPEFAGYDELQAMSTEQLVALAQDQLASGTLDARLADPQTRHWKLPVRFEAPASNPPP